MSSTFEKESRMGSGKKKGTTRELKLSRILMTCVNVQQIDFYPIKGYKAVIAVLFSFLLYLL